MTKEKNIVMFPFMAYGHLNPFMALAKQLERRKGYTITIINTPLNIKKLQSSLSPNTSIRLVEIPFNGTDYGLPPNVENTENLPCELIIPFLIASENLQSSFKNILIDIAKDDGSPMACIISDMFLGWTAEVANELGIFHAVFIAGADYSMAVYFSISLDNMQKCKPEEGEYFTLQDFPEATKIEQSRLGDDLKLNDATEAWWLFRKRQFSLCLCSDAVLLNTIEGLGEIGIKYFSRKLGGKPVCEIGPACNCGNKDGDDKHVDTLSAWLDLHPPASVLIVSFGSQNTILPSQMKELAHGLEASGKAFIWVIRPPIGCSAAEELEPEWFPDGFEERIRRKNQGVLVRKWAPQVEMLSHESTGAFLSHCGWNSVLESLSQGVPMIAWPLAGEQFFNSKMLEEAGVCVEIEREVESADVKHDHIVGVIKMVMGETEKGEELRRRAREIKVKLGDAIKEREGFKGSSIRAMDEFLNAVSLTESKRSVLITKVEI